LAPASASKAVFAETLPPTLITALRIHNDTHPDAQRIRLRMALHAGEVHYDDHGVTSSSLTLAFRLADAQPLKAALAASPGILAVITSSWFFDDVVRHTPGAAPATYRSVSVSEKETTTVGWIALPDHPYLADDTQLTAPSAAGHLDSRSRLNAVPAPRQLPLLPASFVGRDCEGAALTRALSNARGSAGTIVISALAGAGGIGKTWLAVHWAHQNIHRFPDGQLFVDLRGFSPDSEPMKAAVAVRGFLDALGMDPAAIPVDLQAQAALWRSLVVGRRMLIVLDNAANAEQVIPLLPGGNLCTVVITSRRTLTQLIARHGARHLALDTLSTEDAHALLSQRMGMARVRAEPGAAAELIELCGGFPLALGIIAGRAHAHPQTPLAEIANELRVLGLGALEDEDPAASLPTVLSHSYRALTASQRTAFGLLGIAPGPDISLPAAASLTGLSLGRAGQVLRGLEEASLVSRDARGRYFIHDLIRDYAATDQQQLDEDTRNVALRRLVDFYLHTAHTADGLLNRHPDQIKLDEPAAGCHPYPLVEEAAAWAWFDAEHANLLAAQQLALDRGWHSAVWQLAWALIAFHVRRGHLRDGIAAWQAGAIAAEHLGDPGAQNRVSRWLGDAYARVGRHAEALEHLQRALTLAEHTGDRKGQAHTHRAFALAWSRHGDDQQALEHARHALRLFQELDDVLWHAHMLQGVGWHTARLGHYDQARPPLETALALFRRHYDPEGEADTWNSLGYIADHTHQHPRALDCYREALTLYRQVGYSYNEADTLRQLGDTYASLRQPAQARRYWKEALQLYRAQQRTDDARDIQQQLAVLDDEPESRD
jgi:tetratricopeptide (TPR) repeat protein